MSMNVCLDNVFWIAEHFVTKLGMVMQRHEPEGRTDFFFYLQGQGHSVGSLDQNITFYHIFRTVGSLATKLGLVIHHHKPACLVKKNGFLRSRSRSQRRIKMPVFVQMISSKPPNILFPNLVL